MKRSTQREKTALVHEKLNSSHEDGVLGKEGDVLL